jgi:uncharacterized membrane protein YfcA
MGVEAWVAAALAGVAFLAGFVDAIAGGGGLLQMPPLFAVLGPAAAPGVNKAASICGTSAAVARYARHGTVRWDRLAVAGPLAFAGSAVGSWGYLEAVRHAADVVRPAFAVCFAALAVQQVRRALRRGQEPPPRPARPGVGLAFVAAIGLYDGFVGPGTGMFLFWAFTTWLALPALEATSTTKAVNWLTNAGALAVFAARGAVLWPLALVMAAGNAAGGFLGARTAIRGGVRLIRLVTGCVSLAASVYLLLEWALSRPA